MDFEETKSMKMPDDDIAKAVNNKITLFGLTPDEWGWCMMQVGIFFGIMVMTSVAMIWLGRAIDPVVGDYARGLLNWSLAFTPIFIFLAVRALRNITKVFGENTAFLVLSQHNLFSILWNKKTGKKNYDFNPIPNNGYRRIE
jgi:hypothetical protein